jgi:hypothetical protein
MGDLFNDVARPALNWLAVGGAGLAAFMVGAVWYNPKVFGATWMKLSGITEADAKKGNVGMIMGGAFALTVLTAYCIARLMLVGGGWQGGAKIGLFVGTAVALGTGINYLFEQKPMQLWAINGGHQLATCVLMGAILGAWR